MYFISQVSKVEGGDFVVSLPGTRRVATTFASKGPNSPINVETFQLIRKSSYKELLDLRGEPHIGDQYAIFPTIVFEVMEREAIWHYPPTAEGSKRRDADYEFIMQAVGKQCPKDLPSTQR